MSKANGKEFNSHLLKAHIEKRVKIFGQNLDYKNRTPTKTSYQAPNKIKIDQDFITSVGQKKVLLSQNPQDTNPFNIGSTGQHLNNALQHYKMRVEKNNLRNMQTLENNNLLKYFKLNEEKYGQGLEKNDQVTNFYSQMAHISKSQGKKVNSHIKRLQKFELQEMNKISGIMPEKRRGQSFKSKMSTIADSKKGLFDFSDGMQSKNTINNSSLKLPQISGVADRSSPRVFEQRKASLMTVFQLNSMGNNSTNKQSRNAISYNYGTQNYSQARLKNDPFNYGLSSVQHESDASTTALHKSSAIQRSVQQMQNRHARASSVIENYADMQQKEPINLTNFESKNSHQYLHIDPSRKQIQGSEYQYIDDDIDVNKIESTDKISIYKKIDSQSQIFSNQLNLQSEQLTASPNGPRDSVGVSQKRLMKINVQSGAFLSQESSKSPKQHQKSLKIVSDPRGSASYSSRNSPSKGKPLNLKIKTSPDKRLKRKYSPKAYKDASEIMRDSYTDVELTPKANDPRINAHRLEQRMLKKEEERQFKETGAHKINKKVAMAQKNKVHIGLLSVPKIEISKDANKEAKAQALNRKFKDQLQGKKLVQLVTPIEEVKDSRPQTPDILIDDRVPSPSSTQSNPLYPERVRQLRNEKEFSSRVDDLLDKSQIKVNEKLNPKQIEKVNPLLSTHQMALVKRQSIKPLDPEFKIENEILKYQEQNDPSYHARIKINNIAEIKPPPRIVDNKKVIEKVEKELHYIAMRDDSVLPKLIEQEDGHQEIKKEILDVWGEIEDELKYGRKVAEELLDPKNLDRLNRQFWAHLEEEKKNIKSKQGMPIVSEEYERIMAEKRHIIEFDYNSLNITQKKEINKFVQKTRRDWTKEKIDLYLETESKARGVTWLNLDDHFDEMKLGMPSMLDKQDCTFTKIPNLYVRTIREIYDDCIENKKQMWAYYHLWRFKNRIAEHRRAMKKQTTQMLKPWRKTLDYERLQDERNCMFETFGRAFLTNDNQNQRNRKFKKIKQSKTAQEDSDHNSDTEQKYDKYFDDQLNQFDQLTVGEEAILHQLDLYRQVEKFSEEYDFKGKEMKSPLMTFLSMLNKGIVNGRIQPQLPKTFGLTHRKKADEINVNSFQITDEYIDPLSGAFALSVHLRKLDLRRCNLSTKNCAKIIQHLPENLEVLNMSHNLEFGPSNAQLICEEVLSDPRFILDSVVLEECAIGDEGFVHFGTLLSDKNASLVHLDVSKNKISHKGSNEFFELFKQNKRMKVLQMHYNPLGYRGSKMLAEMLQINQSLEVLDISYCNLGLALDGGETWFDLERERIRKENEFQAMRLNPNKQNIPLTKEQIAAREAVKKRKEKEAIAAANLRNRLPPRKKQKLEYDFEPAEEWEKAFAKNSNLVHLDMSYNDFDSQEVEILKRGLDQNKSIYGIHFQGNEGKIDNNGFVNFHDHEAQKEIEDVGLQGIFTRIQPTLQAGVHKCLTRIRLQATSNCWICEGWSPMKFQFMPDEWIDTDLVPIKLHLSCDNYVGEFLAQDKELTEKAQEKEDERLKIVQEQQDAEDQKRFEAYTESVHVEEKIDLDSVDVLQLNEREREAVLNGDEEDIGKIVNIDKIMKQMAKLEKTRTMSETVSPLVKNTKSKEGTNTAKSQQDSNSEDETNTPQVKQENTISEVGSRTQSRLDSEDRKNQELQEIAMEQVKTTLQIKIKKIVAQEQKLVKIIEFPEKHTKKLSKEEQRAKEEAERAAETNFGLPQPPENPYETEHFIKKRTKEEAVQNVRAEKARIIREKQEKKQKEEDDLAEKEAVRLKDYLDKLPPDPDGNPPVIDLKPLRRPPSGNPPKQVFSIIRMVPPGTQNYYFTVNEVKQGLNPDVEQISTMKLVHGGPKLAMLNVPRTNIIRNIIQDRNDWDRPYRSSEISCVPRPVPFNLAGRLSEKPQWDFRESIFFKYKPDTKKILDGCFETDWEFTKIPKLLKYDTAQIKKLKEYMKANYKGLREVYKYFAGVQAMRVASLASSGLVEILKHCDKPVGWKAGDPLKPFIDGKIFKASDVEFQMININGGKQGPPNWLSPDKNLVRYQFLEVLVRVSSDRYFKKDNKNPENVDNLADATILSFENHFLEYFKTYNSHNWRKENLWKEEVDLVYTRFNKYLESVYKKFVGKFPTPGSPKLTMSSEEFLSFLGEADLLNEGFAVKQAGPLWNVSVQTNKDELDNEKHLCMNYVEFQECLARVAENFVVDDQDNVLCLEDHFPEFKAKHPKLLDKKLECTIIKILKALIPERQFGFAMANYTSLVEKDLEKERSGPQTVYS